MKLGAVGTFLVLCVTGIVAVLVSAGHDRTQDEDLYRLGLGGYIEDCVGRALSATAPIFINKSLPCPTTAAFKPKLRMTYSRLKSDRVDLPVIRISDGKSVRNATIWVFGGPLGRISSKHFENAYVELHRLIGDGSVNLYIPLYTGSAYRPDPVDFSVARSTAEIGSLYTELMKIHGSEKTYLIGESYGGFLVSEVAEIYRANRPIVVLVSPPVVEIERVYGYMNEDILMQRRFDDQVLTFGQGRDNNLIFISRSRLQYFREAIDENHFKSVIERTYFSDVQSCFLIFYGSGDRDIFAGKNAGSVVPDDKRWNIFNSVAHRLSTNEELLLLNFIKVKWSEVEQCAR